MRCAVGGGDGVKQIFALTHEQARRNAVQAVQNAPEGYVVRIEEPNRSLEQNAAQWPILQAFSEQLEWPVNGRMVKMPPDDWKDLLTAAFQNETARLAMGLDGGVVMLGLRTSQMSKKRFSEWLEFLHSVAAERGVSVYEETNGLRKDGATLSDLARRFGADQSTISRAVRGRCWGSSDAK